MTIAINPKKRTDRRAWHWGTTSAGGFPSLIPNNIVGHTALRCCLFPTETLGVLDNSGFEAAPRVLEGFRGSGVPVPGHEYCWMLGTHFL